MPRLSPAAKLAPPHPDDLRAALERLLSGGAVEVFEQDKFLPQLAGFQFEVRAQASRVLLELWSEQGNLVRQVMGVRESNDSRLSLDVLRFGKKEPLRLEFICKDSARKPERLTRERFRARFAQFLQEQFPDEKLESLTAAPDLEHSFSGNFTRGVLSRSGLQWALLAAAPGELPATLDGALTFGLLWLAAVREQASRRVTSGLRLFLPEAATTSAAFRLQAISSDATIELFAYDEATWRARRISISDSGNVATRLTPLKEVQRTLEAAHADVEKILALAPSAIDRVVPPGTKEVALRFRGLEFARWKSGAIEFGIEHRNRLTPAKWPQLQKLVAKLETYRHPQAENTAHPVYRLAAERWLETLLLKDPQRIDARLDPRHVYSQVPAFSSRDRGVLDLLAATRDGRLVIIELKASQDMHLPLQAADYWLRVRAHQHAGDLQRFGYFSGIELRDSPPLLYLIAPGFQFHPTTDTILHALSADIEVTRIGLNENWRRGVQVIFRM